jgi:hypothetical protein
MLSNFYNHIFVVYKLLGCPLTLKVQRLIQNNVQIKSFELIVFEFMFGVD